MKQFSLLCCTRPLGDIRKLITNQENVSFTMAKQLFSTKIKQEEDSNIIFSPLSISVLLGLIASGSDSSTRDEVLAFLNSDSVDDFNTFFSRIVTDIFTDRHLVGGPRMSVANGVWIEQTETIKPSFEAVAKNVYNSVVKSVDFMHKATEAVNEVNSFVRKKTNGLIQNLLSPASLVDNETRLVLVSAIYFKGGWSKIFEPHLTQTGKFHLLNGSTVEVPFMSNGEKQYADAFDDFKILKLPYKHGMDTRRFSMYILLPHAHDGLPSLIDKVCSEPGFLQHHSPNKAVSLSNFYIPRFRVSFEFEASSLLKELGVVSAFRREGSITGMVESPEGVYVSKVIHKCVFKVFEKGTEAAAATAMQFGVGCARNRPKITSFVANRPFLFLVQEDKSGVILFIGAVLNPLSS